MPFLHLRHPRIFIIVFRRPRKLRLSDVIGQLVIGVG